MNRVHHEPAARAGIRLDGIIMSEHLRRQAEHNLRTAEAIVDFFYALVARARNVRGGLRALADPIAPMTSTGSTRSGL